MYIIAELGANWKTLQDVLECVKIANKCGADALKLQWFSHADMFGFGDDRKNMSPTMIETVYTACEREGIDFMCSVFNPEDVKFLDQYVAYHKVASCEMSHTPLLKTLRGCIKPLILSTGGHAIDEIKEAVDLCNPDILMYCCVQYPSKWHDIQHVAELAETFPDCAIGYSDHSLDISCSPGAMAEMGVEIFEKHVNFLNYDDTPDAPHSLNAAEFTAYCDYLKDPVAASKKYGRKTGDNSVKLFHKRRLVATCDILQGETLRLGGNYGVFRSKSADLRGASGFLADAINGTIAKVKVSRGTAINVSDVQIVETT